MAKRVCVIGAGPSGITAARNCIQAGLDVVVFEKNDRVGGNWVFNAKTGHSSVYENTHIISSKVLSEYENFPMPEHYPDYPSHRQMRPYFESYACHFGVLPRVRFEHEVRHVKSLANGAFELHYLDAAKREQVETFELLMVANGHHWGPRYPDVPGTFLGRYMHYEFQPAARHSTQVDYHMFRAELKRELSKAGIDIGESPLGRKGKYRPERVDLAGLSDGA